MNLSLQLREVTQRLVSFINRMIESEIEQVNSKTEISVIWKPIKSARYVELIQLNYILDEVVVSNLVRVKNPSN